MKSTGGMEIHNIGQGGLFEPTDHYSGVFYEYLTSTQVLVCRLKDDMSTDQIRVRIWVIN
jgi:hypothetical protein